MKDSLTDITFLLDRTGSMQEKASDVVGGYNAFIDEQKKAPGEALFSFIQFDSQDSHEVIHNAKPIATIPEMKPTDFHPRSQTPLYDAMGTAIVKTGERLAAMPETERPGKVVFVVLTDGLENASREYGKARVKQMVETQQSVYKWAFIFLGVGIDAMAAGAEIGVASSTTADCAEEKTSGGIQSASKKLRSYRTSGNMSDLNYSPADRKSLKS